MRFYRTGARRWRFSLAEAVVVAIALAVVGGIVRPRMSRATGSDLDVADQVLAGQLKALRGAIAEYAADHGGRVPEEGRVEEQLTGFTDIDGAGGAVRSDRFCYGPYLGQFPALAVGERRGLRSVGEGGGWVYRGGNIRGNFGVKEVDLSGKAYRDY